MTNTPKPTAKAPAKRPVVAKTNARAEPDEVPENEVLRETRAATAHRDAKPSSGKVDWKTAAGVGVGSAALIAALLYANRGKK